MLPNVNWYPHESKKQGKNEEAWNSGSLPDAFRQEHGEGVAVPFMALGWDRTRAINVAPTPVGKSTARA
jgi:hypothetical protein